jgi:hypothetical protein
MLSGCEDTFTQKNPFLFCSIGKTVSRNLLGCKVWEGTLILEALRLIAAFMEFVLLCQLPLA